MSKSVIPLEHTGRGVTWWQTSSPPHLLFHLSAIHLWLLAVSFKVSFPFWCPSLSHKMLVPPCVPLPEDTSWLLHFQASQKLTIFSVISKVSKSLLPLADLLILRLYHMYVPNLCLHLLFKSSFLSQQVVHDKLKKGPTFKTKIS